MMVPENDHDDAVEAEELSLVDEDESLPWLESDYDDEDEGFDSTRFIGFVLLSVAVLALLIGAVWFFSNRGPDPELVADGSTIEAPEGPAKVRPEDAGGKTFAGTGNVAPQVGEGLSREARLAQGNAPKPSIDAATPENQPTTSEGATGSVGVQVGAFGTKAGATQAWSTLAGQTQALKGFNYRVVEGEVDGGTVFRLQAVAGDAAAARQLCNALKADGIACQVKN